MRCMAMYSADGGRQDVRPDSQLLKREFTVPRRNQAWVTDITYIRTCQGWLYLAVVMDLFSRKIVGWTTAPTIHWRSCERGALEVTDRSPVQSDVLFLERRRKCWRV